jgi:glycosyltransferase involved in cell wall biosynthesis
LKIAYLVNRYPAPSHSFVRREIAAIEKAGAEVVRYSVRKADNSALPDADDQAEYAKTRVILAVSKLQLIGELIHVALRSPVRTVAAVKTALAAAALRPTNIARCIGYLAEAAWLSRRLVNDGTDHLHAHFGTNPAMVARLSRVLGGPSYSFTVHGPDEFDQPLALDLKGKVASSAFCVAISSFGRGQLMRWSYLTDWKKIEVVRCGVDDSFLNGAGHEPIPRSPRLCAVARLSGQKGIPLLIEAAAMLKDQGMVFELILVGGGEMQCEIEKMICDLNLNDCVRLIGWASSQQVVTHLLSSRAMVLPSFAEGLPVVIMEALALGRPVIVSAIAGTPELVDRDCGWLIPSGSVEMLAQAMKAALTASEEELEAKGRVGRSRVVELHDSDRNGTQLLELIKRYGRGDG